MICAEFGLGIQAPKMLNLKNVYLSYNYALSVSIKKPAAKEIVITDRRIQIICVTVRAHSFRRGQSLTLP